MWAGGRGLLVAARRIPSRWHRHNAAVNRQVESNLQLYLWRTAEVGGPDVLWVAIEHPQAKIRVKTRPIATQRRLKQIYATYFAGCVAGRQADPKLQHHCFSDSILV